MKWLEKLFGLEKRAPTSRNVATFRREPRNVYVLHIGGVLHKATLDAVQKMAARDIEAGVRNLKVLLILDAFRGWRRGDDWGDLDFFARYEEHIARIAVVGDVRWEAETLMFLAAGHRHGDLRYFPPGEETTARAWLAP